MINQDLQNSNYRIRKLIGILGLCLPFLLLITQTELLASISHYYYYKLPALFFIIILSAFALFLISYKGYAKDTNTERLSDDFITNIAGFAALIVVVIPTRCLGSTSAVIDFMCSNENYHLLGHNDKILGAIHLTSAGVFILAMGWMSKYKFTKSSNDKNNHIYRICGNIVFAAIAALIILIVLEKQDVSFWLDAYYVFILETIAIVPFGISWLIKGKAIEDVKALFTSKV